MRLQHVVSGVRSIPSAIIYHAYIDCPDSSHCKLYILIKNKKQIKKQNTELLVRYRAFSRSLISACRELRTDMSPLPRGVRALLTPVAVISSQRLDSVHLTALCHRSVLTKVRLAQEPSREGSPASESPERRESGCPRGAGIEFHSVAGESCCAGVQVFLYPCGPQSR